MNQAIREEKTETGNNETIIKKGVYKTQNGYEWMTYTKSGECKKLETAMRKAGF